MVTAPVRPEYSTRWELLAAEGTPGPSSLVVGETLEDFFTAAIDYSPQLRIAEEGLNIGRAREKQAQGRLQPQVGQIQRMLLLLQHAASARWARSTRMPTFILLKHVIYFSDEW